MALTKKHGKKKIVEKERERERERTVSDIRFKLTICKQALPNSRV